MNYDLIIKNGTVVMDNGEKVTDIAVKDGKIAAIGTQLGEATKVIDAKGMIVTPGLIDAHTHITDPGGIARSEWEGYVTGTKAAAKGGVTTCIEMPLNQLPCTADKESLEIKMQAGKDHLSVDVASLGALIPRNLDNLQELAEAGVVGYKAFLATCGDPSLGNDMANVDDYSLYEGMRRIEKTDKPLLLHCENAAITDKLGALYAKEGPQTLSNYVASRPIFTEVEAIRRAIYLAKQTGVKLHICHVSCPEGVEEVNKARAEGMDITCETCTHYLALTTDELDDIGNTAKCSPPIRDKAAQDGLWKHLFNGDILCVVSDHSPCTPELKEGTAFKAWGGIASLQNTYDIFFDEAVQKRGMPLKQFVDITAANVADRFKLKNKGRIAVGNDADFAIIKPNSPYTLTPDDLEYRNKISAFVGRQIGAQIAQTIVRGETVYKLSKGTSHEGYGEFVINA